jgi:hypothetical protein
MATVASYSCAISHTSSLMFDARWPRADFKIVARRVARSAENCRGANSAGGLVTNPVAGRQCPASEGLSGWRACRAEVNVQLSNNYTCSAISARTLHVLRPGGQWPAACYLEVFHDDAGIRAGAAQLDGIE